MPTVFALLGDSKQSFLDSAGDPASGFKLFVYTAGSSAKATSYTESDGLVANANPIVLDSRGETPNGVYVPTGTFKLVLATASDTDPPATPVWTRDNLTPINDVAASAAAEWVASGFTPTFVSTTSFTVPGDQRSTLHVGRRLRTTNTGGTGYHTIKTSAFATDTTTVTVVNDSLVLDSGLSDVSYSLASADNPSLSPHMMSRPRHGWELIKYIDATNGGADDLTEIDIDLPGGADEYTAYKITMRGVVFSAAHSPAIRFRTAGGSFRTGASDYRSTHSVTGATNINNILKLKQ